MTTRGKHNRDLTTKLWAGTAQASASPIETA